MFLKKGHFSRGQNGLSGGQILGMEGHLPSPPPPLTYYVKKRPCDVKKRPCDVSNTPGTFNNIL